MTRSKKNILDDAKGQAIFEFILFMPFLFFVLALLISFGNSINNSINQQKFTRRYLYFNLKGNSNGIHVSELESMAAAQILGVSIFSIGWREKSGSNGTSSYIPCRTMPRFLENLPAEDCDDAKSDRGPMSQESAESMTEAESRELSPYIKVGTLYGVCARTYRFVNGFYEPEYYSLNNCELRGQ